MPRSEICKNKADVWGTSPHMPEGPAIRCSPCTTTQCMQPTSSKGAAARPAIQARSATPPAPAHPRRLRMRNQCPASPGTRPGTAAQRLTTPEAGSEQPTAALGVAGGGNLGVTYRLCGRRCLSSGADARATSRLDIRMRRFYGTADTHLCRLRRRTAYRTIQRPSCRAARPVPPTPAPALPLHRALFRVWKSSPCSRSWRVGPH